MWLLLPAALLLVSEMFGGLSFQDGPLEDPLGK